MTGRSVQALVAAAVLAAVLLVLVLAATSWRPARSAGEPAAPLLSFEYVHDAAPGGGGGAASASGFCMDPQLAQSFVAAELEASVTRATRWWHYEAGVRLAALYDADPRNGPAGLGRGSEPVLEGDGRRFDMLGPVGPPCRPGLTTYGEGDSEKRVCGLGTLAAAAKGSCHVVSIGSNNQWGFEEAIFRATDCTISTFDCTLDAAVPAAIQSRTRFYKLCLGARDHVDQASGRRFVTWPSLLEAAGLTTPPTHLKMDIEGYEFPVMRSILAANVLMPQQISMEIHFLTIQGDPTLPGSARRITAGELALFARELFDVGRYLLIDRHDNPFCGSCTEVVLKRFAC